MNWIIKSWSSLTKEQLYALLKLRQEVFVVEQNCPYLDCDDHDQNSLHIWSEDESGITAYARIVPPMELYQEASIGRVISAERARNKGVARALMHTCLELIEHKYPGDIRIMAQSYLVPFYTSLGFEKRGDEFLEDGLPHWYMLRKGV